MAKVKWMPGIEYVSGALCKSGKQQLTKLKHIYYEAH